MNDDNLAETAQTVEHDDQCEATNENQPKVRLSRSEKKALKAGKLLEKRKTKYKEYKIRKKARIQSQIESGEAVVIHNKKALAHDHLRNALISGINVCVDVSYDDIHSEKELFSLSRQLALAYGFLKKAPTPIHLHLCGLKETNTLFEKLQSQGFDSWIIDKHSERPWEMFPVSSLIMLSPDAEEAIETFEADKVRKPADLFPFLLYCLLFIVSSRFTLSEESSIAL
jgi:Trm5-related predicted tRNA methylase